MLADEYCSRGNALRSLSSVNFLKAKVVAVAPASAQRGVHSRDAFPCTTRQGAAICKVQGHGVAVPMPDREPRTQGLQLLHRTFGVQQMLARKTDVRRDLIPVAAYSVREGKPALADVLANAGKKALGGGVPGMVAMVIQVFSLMWMRTTINYQYRHGGTMVGTMKTLYSQGGIPRFYQGLLPALVQGPLSRFGDTAANTGMLALLDSYETTENLPVAVKTLAASGAAASFRIVLMPVDALKTTLQVEGASGLAHLGSKIRVGGPGVLWHGALAASGATFVGHYPWFATYNYLNAYLPQYDDLPRRLLRSALIGFTASAISDTCSNSIRVIKTTKQTSADPITYMAALKMVLEKDGIRGLFFRGLSTKILSNGMQGLMFSVLWRLGMDYWNKLEKEKDDAKKRQ